MQGRAVRKTRRPAFLCRLKRQSAGGGVLQFFVFGLISRMPRSVSSVEEGLIPNQAAPR